MCLPYFRSKRNETKFGKFEMLNSKWDSDNCDTEKCPNNQMSYGKFPAKDDKPDDIKNKSPGAKIT